MAIQPLWGPSGLVQLEGRGDSSASMGAALGGGIGKGLQALAEHKMAEIMQRKQMQQHELMRQQQVKRAMPYLQAHGATEQEAIDFLNLPEHIQKSELDRANGLQFQGAQPQQQQQQMPQQAFQEPLIPQQQQEQSLQLPETQVPQKAVNPVKQGYSHREANKLLDEYVKEQKKMTSANIRAQHAQLKQEIKQHYAPQRAAPKPEPLSVGIGGNDNKRIAQEKLALKKEEATNARAKELWQFNGKEYKQIQKGAISAEETLKNVDILKNATSEGENDSQAWLSFLRGLGVDDYEGFINNKTQMINKANASFVNGIKDVFGAGAAVSEMNQYMKQFPNAFTDPQAFKHLVSLIEYKAKGDIEKGKIMQEVIDDNGGNPPRDLILQIDSRWKTKKQPLLKAMNAEIKRALTEEEASRKSSRGANLAAYGAGKVIGGIGSIIGKVAKVGAGAALGGAVGGNTGRAVGGVLGGLE